MEQLLQFIINHWSLCLTASTILILIFINEILIKQKGALAISPALAVDLLNNKGAVIIDLRNADAFRNGHIINAINITGDAFIKEHLIKYKNKPLIIVCARGLEAGQLAARLKKQGLTDTMTLKGGIAAWQAAQLPLVKGKNEK